MTIQSSDAEAAAVAKDKRITLADIEGAIAYEAYVTARDALVTIISRPFTDANACAPQVLASLERMTICILVMRNGFTVVGKSAPLAAANFNAELGRKFAYEDAIRQLWPLMAFSELDRRLEPNALELGAAVRRAGLAGA